MSNVLNRTTKDYLESVNTPDYPIADWIISPDLSDVAGVPSRYWKIVGDTVSEMNQSEKDAVDAALVPGAKVAKKEELKNDGDSLVVSRRYSDSVKDSLNIMYSESLRMRPNRVSYLKPWVSWIDEVDTEVKTKQESVDLQTALDDVNGITIDSSTLISHDPEITIAGALAVTDAMDIETFLDENSVVEDPVTGIEGPFYLMQILQMRKDLYNDDENPIYESGHLPILGGSGMLQDHVSRINNIENIHGKLGWHNQQVQQTLYHRPKNLLIYYGYPNSFNSGTHGWYNEKVAQEMAKYSLIVLGDGVEDPSHGDYANTQIIIPRIKALNPSCLIFGYVSVNQTLVNFKTKTDQWNTLQVHGIFMDEAGYDYGKTRSEFNEVVDYVHEKTYSKAAFVNAWNTDHILGTANDVSYPNSTYNSGVIASKLNTSDWILLESFAINTTAYSGTSGYASKSDWSARGVKAVNLRATYGVNFAAIGIIDDGNVNESSLFNFGYIASLLFSLEAVGSANTSYGSSDAKTKFIARPDISDMDCLWSLNPSVQIDTLDVDVYHRYVENGKLSVDFSSGAQTSTISKW